MRILLVEDDDSTAEVLRHALSGLHYGVDRARSAGEAMETFDEATHKLILLDLSLPDRPGVDLLRSLRRRHDVPVLILSATGELDAKLSSFGAGADDYLTKPFNLRELSARIDAVLRRERDHGRNCLSQGCVSADLSRAEIRVNYQRLQVTPTEFSILEYLLRASGRTVPKTRLATFVWGDAEPRNFRKIDVFLSTLRQKLAAVGGGDASIETVWGEGVILRACKSAGVKDFA